MQSPDFQNSSSLAPTELYAALDCALEDLDAQQILAGFDQHERELQDALLAANDGVITMAQAMAQCLSQGGRIIYVGAGTSGRLGLLDSAEWGPTFGLESGRLVALLAGGEQAFRHAVEGAEDSEESVAELKELSLSSQDLLVGISASGSAKYVRSALAYAAGLSCPRALISANPNAVDGLPGVIEVIFESGAELLAGSTRLKAATATHRILQRASLLCAVQMGWIYQGQMVCMRATNDKLRSRALRMLIGIAKVEPEEAQKTLLAADYQIPVAIIMLKLSMLPDQAASRLRAAGGRLATALGEVT